MIDTLAGGFEVVNRHLWIILLPVAIDLFLSFGPQLSVLPALERLLALYQATAGQAGVAGMLPPAFGEAGAGGDPLAPWARFNGFAVLTMNFVAAVPSLLAAVPTLAQPLSGPLRIEGLGPTLATGLALEIIGLGLASLYFGFIGQQVRDGETTPAAVLRGALRYWGRCLQLLLLALALLLALSLVAGMVLTAGFLVHPAVGDALARLITVALEVLMLVFAFSFFFAKDAIVISEARPLEALAASATVVLRNLWSSTLLIVLIHLIVWGFQSIFAEIARLGGYAGLIAAIVGNAYLWSGTAGASMRFYNSRVPAGAPLSARRGPR